MWRKGLWNWVRCPLGKCKIAPYWLAEPADMCGPEYNVYRYDMYAHLLQQESEMSH